MAITGAEEAIPARNGGSELVDYSLKESNRRLILERRKVALLSDRNGSYNSSTNDVIAVTIAPGANDEWLDGRSSYITATLNVTGTGADKVYLPNGPAACFQQVQIISASGQQLVNIMDYHTIEQMFTEFTTCPTWTEGAGQMYGAGNWETGQWDPAVFLDTTVTTAGYADANNPAAYDPFSTAVPPIGTLGTVNAAAVGDNVVMQKNAGQALALQAGLSKTGGVRVAFRLNLAWLFGNATLIPSQYFPLTLRATLASPATTLSWIGIDSALNLATNSSDAAVDGTGLQAPTTIGPYCLANTNTVPVPGVSKAGAALSGIELSFNNVKFMASLCKVSPTFKAKVEHEMAAGSFSMTVTNYYTALNTIAGGNSNPTINTTFSAHDCQAFYLSFVPQAGDSSFNYNFGYKWGGAIQRGTQSGQPIIASSQLLLNGRYFPPQPNTSLVDQFHDTLDAFNTSSENVAFSPVSYYSYYAGRNYVIGFLLDRDSGSSLTGVSSVSSPVWTWVGSIPYASTLLKNTLNVHTCIAFTQVLEIQKDGQIKIFQ